MPFYNTRFSAVVPCHALEEPLCDYLARRYTYHDKKAWCNLIGKGRLTINGRTAGETSPVRAGDSLSFEVKDHFEPSPPCGVKILLEKSGLLFVHKPAGLPVHRTGKVIFNTLVRLVREKTGDNGVSPLNRLDAESTGIVIFRRRLDSHHAAISGARWTKLYAAIVRGRMPHKHGYISQPLEMLSDSKIRCQMHPVASGRHALTFYEVIGSHSGLQLVAAFLATGRKHQLRAHFAWAGAPVLGDKIYSLDGRFYIQRLERELNQIELEELGARHHLLHCFFTGFKKPGCEGVSVEDWGLDEEFTGRFRVGIVQKWYNSEACSRFLEDAEKFKQVPDGLDGSAAG